MTETTSAPSKNTGARLYDKAKKRIPGGTQLLSKRPEMFLPDQWPAYYKRAKGCEVWDMDDRRLIDMTNNGIGACLLGFADDDVNTAVKQCVDAGNMCTLNSPAEVELADLLCEIHPWADKVRYARTGGEIMSVAVRIARAYTGRDTVAICGYHGWQDWYLAANLSADQALDGHLLPGLVPTGVPRNLAGTALPFRYGQIEQLEEIAKQQTDQLAAIIMEPLRYDMPEPDFLPRVQEIADRTGAVLIFDEITAGWRYHFGGVHLTLGVEPDIATFAKSMSNGYPMAAVIGRSKVMAAAEVSFISSTYWTEAIGPTAALATLHKMREVKLSDHLRNIGKLAQAGWKRLGEKHDLKLKVYGLEALGGFKLDYGDQSQALTTLITQEMLDRGFLASTTLYATLAHTPTIVDQYLSALDETFGEIKAAIDAGDVQSRLRGPVAHSGFQRLT